MSKLIMMVLLFSSHFALAQRAPTPEELQLAQDTLNDSGGTCDVLVDPHSFACNDWVFSGNNIFPLFEMNWSSRSIQGRWTMVTYADNSGSEDRSHQFIMRKMLGRSTVPAGVQELTTGRMVGDVQINGNSMVFNNWRGQRMTTAPNTFIELDPFTVQMQAVDSDRATHTFHCRDFNRQNTHHLICLWQSRGQLAYFGFLKARDQN